MTPLLQSQWWSQVNARQVEGGTCHQQEAGRYNHVYEYPLTALLTMFSIILAMLNGGIRCLHDDACLYDLV